MTDMVPLDKVIGIVDHADDGAMAVLALRELDTMRISARVIEADREVRGDGLPEWVAQDWLTGALHSLGRAAEAAARGDVEVFGVLMAAVAAVALHAVEQAEAGKVETRKLTS